MIRVKKSVTESDFRDIDQADGLCYDGQSVQP
jgi:hypothetical protein